MVWLNDLFDILDRYKGVIAIGFIGAMLNIGSRPDKGIGRKIMDLLIGLLSSIFFGWISYEVVKFIWQSEGLALAACGFFSWKGATWIGEKIDLFIDAKINKTNDEVN
ncbi:hypothetical protein [Campylobacter curvus]|jgi:hypothetical protein|uniref:hypothetical protein n=1 Tax=Campylobacter curvus TaxID=200 RepID=UPI00146FEE0B|nr:hypothetical protein [Campylobacter curvus]